MTKKDKCEGFTLTNDHFVRRSDLLALLRYAGISALFLIAVLLGFFFMFQRGTPEVMAVLSESTRHGAVIYDALILGFFAWGAWWNIFNSLDAISKGV